MIHGQDCGGILACHSCRADAWAAGRLRHTDACQMRQTPPEGFPFDSFSCNCDGELVPAWLPSGVDREPIDDTLWRGRSQLAERTWVYALREGERWVALPVTEEFVADVEGAEAYIRSEIARLITGNGEQPEGPRGILAAAEDWTEEPT